VALELDSMDEDQVRTAAKLLECENERLLREVPELKQKLSAAQGNSFEQMTLLAELEKKLAARNRMLFGRLALRTRLSRRASRWND
jgi:cell division septum initiation protein DivIVA